MLTRGPMALAMEDMTTCRPEAQTFVNFTVLRKETFIDILNSYSFQFETMYL